MTVGSNQFSLGFTLSSLVSSVVSPLSSEASSSCLQGFPLSRYLHWLRASPLRTQFSSFLPIQSAATFSPSPFLHQLQIPRKPFYQPLLAATPLPLPTLSSSQSLLPPLQALCSLLVEALPLTLSPFTNDSNSWYRPRVLLALSSCLSRLILCPTAVYLKDPLIPPHLQLPGDPASYCGERA